MLDKGALYLCTPREVRESPRRRGDDGASRVLGTPLGNISWPSIRTAVTFADFGRFLTQFQQERSFYSLNGVATLDGVAIPRLSGGGWDLWEVKPTAYSMPGALALFLGCPATTNQSHHRLFYIPVVMRNQAQKTHFTNNMLGALGWTTFFPSQSNGTWRTNLICSSIFSRVGLA